MQTRCEDCKKRCVYHAYHLHNQCRYASRCKTSKCYCENIESYPKMEIRPITFRQACDFVVEHHYHSPTEGGIGCNFCEGFYINDKLVGVAMICGRPVGIKPDKEFTCEVNRLCTDGTYNGWAMLYETCRQVVKQNGYKKLIVYILESERNETKMVKEGDK